MLCAPRFWIKYISRNEVELLKKGSHGTDEMRQAAATEPDDSPLYGFIRFRRRNVLVKCIPEGTSRVLKGERTQEPGVWGEWFLLLFVSFSSLCLLCLCSRYRSLRAAFCW